MAYTPTEWKDHIVEHPNRYRVVDNGDGTVDILDEHGAVIQQGTPVDATRLNKIEQGIKDAHDAIASHLNDDTAHGVDTKVSKSGDTMTGSLNTTSAFPFYIKLSGKKTWGFHRNGDNLYIAPSASNDGTDLDWSKQTVFYPDGKVSFSGIVEAKGNTSYTVRQFRNIILSTSDPNVSAMQDGDIWIKYR